MTDLIEEAEAMAEDRENYANAMESGIQTTSATDNVLRDCVAIFRADAALIRRMIAQMRQDAEYVAVERGGRIGKV